MAVVEIRKLKVHADARGAVFEPLEPQLLAARPDIVKVLVRVSPAGRVG